jgi:radical SAM protein with 4Fe4S-binding SPASM domain
VLKDQLRRALIPRPRPAAESPAPGLRHYEREIDGARVRYHLRVELDGSGLLIAGAAAVCRLAPSGVVIAEGLLAGQPHGAIRERVRDLFRGARRQQVDADLDRVKQTLADMAFPGRRYPLFNLDDPEATARGRALFAPLCAELGLDGSGDPVARLDALWKVAVPQVIFAHLPGAPPELVVRAVEHAEDLGMIAGVRAPARVLDEDELLARLVDAGLDHVDVYLAATGDDRAAAFHDAHLGVGDHEAALEVFARCAALELCPVAVLPLVAGSLEHLETTMEALPDHGVRAACLFALAEAPGVEAAGGLSAGALRQAVATAEELADTLSLNLVFAPAVERDPNMELADQLRRGPRTAGEASVRVTPDGAVIPAHGAPRAAGNLLERFAEIWSDDAFTPLREATAERERCEACPGLSACARGCPAEPANWALRARPEQG